MKNIRKDTICQYCLGCNRLENSEFEGVRNCSNFFTYYNNWYKDFIKNIYDQKN